LTSTSNVRVSGSNTSDHWTPPEVWERSGNGRSAIENEGERSSGGDSDEADGRGPAVDGVVVNNYGVSRVPVTPHTGSLAIGGEATASDDDTLVALEVTPGWNHVVDLESVVALVGPASVAAGLDARACHIGERIGPGCARSSIEALDAEVVAHGVIIQVGVLVGLASVVACAQVRAVLANWIIVNQIRLVGANSGLVAVPRVIQRGVTGNVVGSSVHAVARDGASGGWQRAYVAGAGNRHTLASLC